MNKNPDYLQKFRDAYRKEYSGILPDQVIGQGNKWFEDFLVQVMEEREPSFPMGVSQWREYGKKYSYYEFFEKQIKKERDKMWLECVPDIRINNASSGTSRTEGFNKCRSQIIDNAKQKNLI